MRRAWATAAGAVVLAMLLLRCTDTPPPAQARATLQLEEVSGLAWLVRLSDPTTHTLRYAWQVAPGAMATHLVVPGRYVVEQSIEPNGQRRTLIIEVAAEETYQWRLAGLSIGPNDSSP